MITDRTLLISVVLVASLGMFAFWRAILNSGQGPGDDSYTTRRAAASVSLLKYAIPVNIFALAISLAIDMLSG